MRKTQKSNNPLSWSNLRITRGEMIGIPIFLVMAVFAYLTPLDVLDKYPQAREFSDFMASWNLQIRRVGEISGPANQANRFVYSVLWCVMPAFWGCLVIHLYRHYRTNRKSLEVTSELNSFLAWLASLVMLYVVFALPTLGELPRIGKAMFINSVTRSLFAPCLVFMVGAIVSNFFLMPLLAFNNRIVIKKDLKNG